MMKQTNMNGLRAGVTVLLLLIASSATGQVVVADEQTHQPLSNASIFGRDGKFAGTSDSRGRIVCVSVSDYPITIRYMGFAERTVTDASLDTILMKENFTELPEVVVETRQKKMLHILAYVREYSNLATYTDTVTMFREKMVDFMLPNDKTSKYTGWRTPRVLNSKSYYRFTNANGLDSVSDRFNQHFTWSDWVGLVPATTIPAKLLTQEQGSDTLWGKYSPAESWNKTDDRITLDINVLADTTSRKWVPNLATFFKQGVDFEQFTMRLNYGNIYNDMITPLELTGYSFNIESRGRGRGMFRFNRHSEPFFVSTYSEVYVLDKDFIPIKEAKKWERCQFDPEAVAIIEPADAPQIHPSVQYLVERVNNIDGDSVRLSLTPDPRIGYRKVVRQNIGDRALQMLKILTGISRVKANKNMEHQWGKFKNK